MIFLKSDKLNNFSISLFSLMAPLAYAYGLTVFEIVGSYKLKLSVYETSKNINIKINFTLIKNIITSWPS